MKDNETMKEAFGKYLLDVSKLVIAGVVINSIFEITDNRTFMLFFGIFVSLVLLVVGLIIINNKK